MTSKERFISFGIIIIGDEILSAKFVEKNAQFALPLLRDKNLKVGKVSIIADDPNEIASEVKAFSERFDYVITSGGIGPTHDDRTIEGVAKAFDQAIIKHPQLEKLIREHLKEKTNNDALKMAEVPKNATLISKMPFPTICVENVYILPGIPKLFSKTLSRLIEDLNGSKLTLCSATAFCHENEIAEILRSLDTVPKLKIGSYPIRIDEEPSIIITIESISSEASHNALNALVKYFNKNDIRYTFDT